MAEAGAVDEDDVVEQQWRVRAPDREDPCEPVAPDGQQTLAVGAEGHRLNGDATRTRVMGERRGRQSFRNAPHPCLAVSTARCDQATIRREREAEHSSIVRQRAHRKTRGGIPDVDRVVCSGSGDETAVRAEHGISESD